MEKLKVPQIPCLKGHALHLARIVAETSFLPDPSTVKAIGGAVFPTVRNPDKRVSPIRSGEQDIGMYDDNTTPRWAFLWAHGIPNTGHPSQWHFAHVWPGADDIDAYCHLANLVMMPECFGNLTDKVGPLTKFLRWHAWTSYGWKPTRANPPEKPTGYDTLHWKYLPAIDDPQQFIEERVSGLNNKRVKILRPIMGIGHEQ